LSDGPCIPKKIRYLYRKPNDRNPSKVNINDSSDFIDTIVFHELSNVTISNGDVYVERAINATLAEWEAQGSAVNLDTLQGNIEVATDYEKYLANESTINDLIAQAPTSNFAAGWIVELQQVAALGLESGNGTAVTGNASVPTTLNYYGMPLYNQSDSNLENILDDPNSTYAAIGQARSGGSGLSLALQRSDLLMIQNGNGNRLSDNGSDNSFTLNVSNNTFTGSGSGNTVTFNGDADTLSMYGNNNAVTVNGQYANIVVSGVSNLLTNANGNVTVADNSGLQVDGVSEQIDVWNDSSLLIDGGQMDVNVGGGNNSITANGNDEAFVLTGTGNTVSIGNGTVSLSDNAGATINGVADQVNVRNTSQLIVNGGSMSLAVNGSQNTITANGNGNRPCGNSAVDTYLIDQNRLRNMRNASIQRIRIG
jgi:hypothetical protein